MSQPAVDRALLEVATKIVATEGVEALTVKRLARETGLSRATLYRFGTSREAILDALENSGTDVGGRAGSRERILAAAKEVFGRTGFDAATIEEIAETARVGPATVYRLFGDKDGLIAEFLDQVAPRRAIRALRLHATGDLRHDLTRLAERILTWMRDEAPLSRLILIEALTAGPALARVRKSSPVRSVAVVASLLREHMAAGRVRDGDAEALARSFAGMLFAAGVLGPILHDAPMDDPALHARMVTDIFLRGVQTRRRSR